jgi:hypothetical protein
MATQRRTREEDDRRISTATRWLLAGGVAATGVFAGLAAEHSHAASPSVEQQQVIPDARTSDSLSQPSSAPQSSSSPPVAQSGGS